jgi:hypothetical protein
MLKDTGVKGPINFCSNKTFAIKRSIKLNKRYKNGCFMTLKRCAILWCIINKPLWISVLIKKTFANKCSIKPMF